MQLHCLGGGGCRSVSSEGRLRLEGEGAHARASYQTRKGWNCRGVHLHYSQHDVWEARSQEI